MKRLLLTLLALALCAGPASATYSSWFGVDWLAPVQTITVRLAGYPTNGGYVASHLAPAAVRTAATQAGITAPGEYVDYRPAFCVDVFFSAFDSWQNRYEVDVHSGADGIDGWVTPVGDKDQWREADGLYRAAALAEHFGGTLNPLSADFIDRSVALNVAIWKASYGTKLSLANLPLSGITNGGLTAQQMTYYGDYLAYYNAGHTSTRYTWFDSDAGDETSYRQDFLTAVPEPNSLMLIGGLLTGAALLASRRRKRP